jgi:hypothetical protein
VGEWVSLLIVSVATSKTVDESDAVASDGAQSDGVDSEGTASDDVASAAFESDADGVDESATASVAMASAGLLDPELPQAATNRLSDVQSNTDVVFMLRPPRVRRTLFAQTGGSAQEMFGEASRPLSSPTAL